MVLVDTPKALDLTLLTFLHVAEFVQALPDFVIEVGDAVDGLIRGDEVSGVEGLGQAAEVAHEGLGFGLIGLVGVEELADGSDDAGVGGDIKVGFGAEPAEDSLRPAFECPELVVEAVEQGLEGLQVGEVGVEVVLAGAGLAVQILDFLDPVGHRLDVGLEVVGLEDLEVALNRLELFDNAHGRVGDDGRCVPHEGFAVPHDLAGHFNKHGLDAHKNARFCSLIAIN